jgi:hypothetical protein
MLKDKERLEDETLFKVLNVSLLIIIIIALLYAGLRRHPADLHHCLVTSTDKSRCDSLR